MWRTGVWRETAIAAGAFLGQHSYTEKVATNRPDTQDIAIAKDFAQKIKAKIEKIDNLSEFSKLEVLGNFPYKIWNTRPSTPLTDEKCVDCKICAKTCPTEAIDLEDVTKIDAEKCIKCSSCVQKCPVKAKHIVTEDIENIRKMLIANFADIRKEPELFI